MAVEELQIHSRFSYSKHGRTGDILPSITDLQHFHNFNFK